MLHDSNNHWFLIFCSNARVQICNSVNPSLTQTSKKPIQQDGHSCSLFAMEVTAEMFGSKSSTDAVFHVPQLRNHLTCCLESAAFLKILIGNVNETTELLYKLHPCLVHKLIVLLIFCIKGLMTETKELQQLHWYYCINLLFLFCYWWLRTSTLHLFIVLFLLWMY